MKFSLAIEFTLTALFVIFLLNLVPTVSITILGNAIAFGFAFFIASYAAMRKTSIRYEDVIAKRERSPNLIGISVSAGVLIYLLYWILIEVEILLKQGNDHYFTNYKHLFLLDPTSRFFITTLFLAPVLEEFFFRGLILTSLEKVYSERKALILSAILFSAVHIQFNDAFLAHLIGPLIGGILIGRIYQRSRNIKDVIITHFVWNFAAYLFPWIMQRSGLEIKSIYGFLILLFALLLAIAMLYLSIVRVLRFNRILPLRVTRP